VFSKSDGTVTVKQSNKKSLSKESSFFVGSDHKEIIDLHRVFLLGAFTEHQENRESVR
jgi:hypothetical protein